MSRWDVFSLGISEILNGKTDQSLVAYIQDACRLCRSYLRSSLGPSVTTDFEFEIVVSNSIEYEKIVKSWQVAKIENKMNTLFVEDYSASIFTRRYGGFAIDLERLLELAKSHDVYNFTINLVLGILDGLIHLSKPWLTQSDVNDLTDFVIVEYLGIPLKDEEMQMEYSAIRENAIQILELETHFDSMKKDEE